LIYREGAPQSRSGNASLQESAATLENVRLVLTAELAADYFNLRELDVKREWCGSRSKSSKKD